MRKRLKQWLGQRSTKGLIGLAIAGVSVLALAGGAAYAALGGFAQVTNGNNIDLQSGLVGWWKLDGNTKDSTPYASDGTINGTVTTAADRKGTANGAYTFDGSTGYLDMGDKAAVNPTGAVTLSAWVKGSIANTGGNVKGIACKDNPPGNPPYCLTVQDGIFTWAVNNGSLYNAISSTSLGTASDNTWYHVVGTYDGSLSSLSQKIFINGVRVSTSGLSTGNLITTSYNFLIGRQKSNVAARFLSGTIDDVRIYNRALSAGEITALYSQYNAQINAASGENGLIGWWKMDNNAKDATPYADDATVSNAILTTDRKGAANSAYNFNGSSACLSRPSAGPLAITGAVSVTAWFNSTATTNTQTILRVGTTANEDYGLIYNGSSHTIALNWYDGAFKAITSPANSVPASGWVHATVTRDASNNVVLYVNGVSVATGTATTPTVLAGPWVIGAGICNTTQQFTGSIDDIRVYKRALSANEVAAQAQSYSSQINLNSSPTNQGTVNLNSGLVGYWPFNGNTKDSTPYQDNGTINGTVTATTDRKSRTGSAYLFNGTNGYIDAGNPAALNLTSAFTISAWVKGSVSNTGGVPVGIGCKNQTSNPVYCLYVQDGNFIVYVRNSTTTSSVGSSALMGLALDNTWYHVVGTYDGSLGASNARIYVNGVYYGSASTVSGALLTSPDTFVIGRQKNTAGRFFNGTIDDVRVYNRALSQTEITALYNNYY